MDGLKFVKHTREYLDYIEEHLLNVQQAWKNIQTACSDMFFIRDKSYFQKLNIEIINHDLSKFSEHEFTQYRQHFYPIGNEDRNMQEAWEHHISKNTHHWENWTKLMEFGNYNYTVDLVHMVVDWVAMSYKFKNPPQQYYEQNKDTIILPKDAETLMLKIFALLNSTEE